MVRYLFQPSRRGEKSRLWSARIRLDEWPAAKTFPLHVADRRVAEHKLNELVIECERSAFGIGIPKATREALRAPLQVHIDAFLAAHAKLSAGTLTKYRQSLPKLCGRCGWTNLREVTAHSFIQWRDSSSLKPKSLNDFLGSMRTFLNWLKRRRLIPEDPLGSVGKLANHGVGSYRRALSVDEINRLLATAPKHRATVYHAMIYTGLRPGEMRSLKWSDFDFAADPPRMNVPSSISKNRKSSVHFLRAELVESLLAFRPADAKPESWAFRGTVPRVPTFKRDLERAKIPFKDSQGRRLDLHALRKTFGTLLSASGVSPRVAMELMRHSDMKLTMQVYTDVSQLPVQQEAARLPSFRIFTNYAAGDAHARDLSVPSPSPSVINGPTPPLSQMPHSEESGQEKAPQDNLRRSSKMERAKRLELSTSTLARWCSTN